MIRVLGLDVGGANLKAALTSGEARSLPFALWRDPLRLTERLRWLAEGWRFDAVALTMTAELCDCFQSKREGVAAIVASVGAAFPNSAISVWTLDGRFASTEEVWREPLRAAAANWLALATWAAQFARHGTNLLLDVGSTTTDIVPLQSGQAAPHGRTDAERMRTGELVYTGVRRTPLCALLGFDVMAELFATTLDVYLLLEMIRPDSADCDTADGRPADLEHARARLARILGEDRDGVDAVALDRLAHRTFRGQRDHLVNQVRRVLNGLPLSVAVVAGSGEFLARAVAEQAGAREVISIAKQLGPDLSSAACAFAVAVLAAEAPS